VFVLAHTVNKRLSITMFVFVALSKMYFVIRVRQ